MTKELKFKELKTVTFRTVSVSYTWKYINNKQTKFLFVVQMKEPANRTYEKIENPFLEYNHAGIVVLEEQLSSFVRSSLEYKDH